MYHVLIYYQFWIFSTVLCTSPTKFSVIDPEGVIAPQSCIDIVVRYMQPSASHCENLDKFRITMYEKNTQQVKIIFIQFTLFLMTWYFLCLYKYYCRNRTYAIIVNLHWILYIYLLAKKRCAFPLFFHFFNWHVFWGFSSS